MKVMVKPQIGKNGCKGFVSNIKPGDLLEYKRSACPINEFLPKIVTVVAEYKYHFTVYDGKYYTSVNKASVYCNKEILYIINKG